MDKVLLSLFLILAAACSRSSQWERVNQQQQVNESQQQFLRDSWECERDAGIASGSGIKPGLLNYWMSQSAVNERYRRCMVSKGYVEK